MRPLPVLLTLLLLVGCDESIDHQNRFKTLGAAHYPGWPGAGEALPLVPGTVPQGTAERAREAAQPPAASMALLRRGQERYGIFCAMCHGLTGGGDGIVVARGFPRPPPFDAPGMMAAPASQLVGAIAQGYGTMYAFADRVAPRDRWAIVAYIRALQLADRGGQPPP